jgi:hypothetical protein
MPPPTVLVSYREARPFVACAAAYIINIMQSWWIWIFSQIPGPSSSLFRGAALLLLRFPRILTVESYYSTS